jgi:PAS domain S-box-containing protein
MNYARVLEFIREQDKIVNLINTERGYLTTDSNSCKIRKFLLEQAQYLFSELDPNGNFTEVNDTFCALSGYSREELLGNSIQLLRSPQMAEYQYDRMWNKLRNGEVWKELLISRNKKREDYYVDTLMAPVFDENGELVRFFSIGRNVTDAFHDKKALIEENKDFKDSMRYAKRLQMALMPNHNLMDTYFNDQYFIVWRPRNIVSGDFYWIEEVGDALFIAAADCSGLGVSGMLLMSLVKSQLDRIILGQKNYQPSSILDELNKMYTSAFNKDSNQLTHHGVAGYNPAEYEGVSISICKILRKQQLLEFAGANLPLLQIHNNNIYEVAPSKYTIGGPELKTEEKVFSNYELEYTPGDQIYLFTQGIIHQFGGPADKHKKYGIEQLKQKLLDTCNESMRTQRALFNFDWKDWKGDTEEQLEDVLMIGIRL